jgi:hypothetical protein
MPPVNETLDPDIDPALATAVLEVESHASSLGWDGPARLYALVETARLVEREPALAASMGLDDASAAGSLTPIEQDQLGAEVLESTLESIMWPDEVVGCAAVVERLVLPPGVDAELPGDIRGAQEYAREHPGRQEVRIAAGVTRAGAAYCALRLRSHDDDLSVVTGTDLVPGLLDLLRATLDLPLAAARQDGLHDDPENHSADHIAGPDEENSR